MELSELPRVLAAFGRYGVESVLVRGAGDGDPYRRIAEVWHTAHILAGRRPPPAGT